MALNFMYSWGSLSCTQNGTIKFSYVLIIPADIFKSFQNNHTNPLSKCSDDVVGSLKITDDYIHIYTLVDTSALDRRHNSHEDLLDAVQSTSRVLIIQQVSLQFKQ